MVEDVVVALRTRVGTGRVRVRAKELRRTPNCAELFKNCAELRAACLVLGRRRDASLLEQIVLREEVEVAEAEVEEVVEVGVVPWCDRKAQRE